MRFEASQDAQFMRPYLENTTITKKKKKKHTPSQVERLKV
jgi:hypothetical protein